MGKVDDERLSSVKEKLRDSGVITNAAAKAYIKKRCQLQKQKSMENNDTECIEKKKGTNIFKFPWTKKENKNDDMNDSSNGSLYPNECGNFLSQAQKKVAEASENPVTRRGSSKQRLALSGIGSSLKWSNM